MELLAARAAATTIVALVDALGSLARFLLQPGHRYDSVVVMPLIDGIACAVIPPKSIC